VNPMRWMLALMLTGSLIAAGGAAASPPVESLRLYVLDCGTLGSLDAARFLPGQGLEGEKLSLVDRCYLIRHPKGNLLWDTGLPAAAASWWRRNLYWVLTLGRVNVRLDRTLVEQLDEIGIAPSDIDYLALSHLHTDHVGTANDYAASTWLVQRAELDVAFDGSVEGIDSSYFEALRDSPRQVLEGDFDVFGDGSVTILSAPGHTPGHQCLSIELPKRGTIVLSGDLYHTKRNRELRVAPSFNTDRELTLESMERIEDWVRTHDAELWIQHDPEANRGLPMSPAFLE